MSAFAIMCTAKQVLVAMGNDRAVRDCCAAAVTATATKRFQHVQWLIVIIKDVAMCICNKPE
jgi:hypothetical protein